MATKEYTEIKEPANLEKLREIEEDLQITITNISSAIAFHEKAAEEILNIPPRWVVCILEDIKKSMEILMEDLEAAQKDHIPFERRDPESQEIQ